MMTSVDRIGMTQPVRVGQRFCRPADFGCFRPDAGYVGPNGFVQAETERLRRRKAGQYSRRAWEGNRLDGRQAVHRPRDGLRSFANGMGRIGASPLSW